jgi:hypothetical protein
MSRQILTSRLYRRVCSFVLFFVAASASFSGFYQKWHFAEAGVAGQYDHAGFEAMVDGTAWRPFVYRQMLPEIANRLDSAIPPSFKNWLYLHQGKGLNAYIVAIDVSPTARNQVYFFRYLVVYVATFLFALLAVYSMYLVCRALEMPQPASTLAPVVLILLLPYIMSVGGYFYDYSELAFLSLAVFIALKFDWWWIIPVAALGTWNKESFLLVVPSLYPIIRQRTSRLGALLAVGVLGLVCASVYLSVRAQFAHNLGGTVEFGLPDQLRAYLHPLNFVLRTEETYGVRVVRAFSLFPMALLAWTVARAWKQLPLAIKRHAQIAAAINIPLYVLFCAVGELRNLSLLYIVLLVALAINLNDWLSGAQPAGTLLPG